MSEVIPSIFNKADFWAMLLPGYVTVILAIIIFDPAVFGMFNSTSGLPFDIFSIVVFIVAGPAVGFILWQIYFHLASLARFSATSFNITYEFQRAYESLRLVCSDSEKDELSLVDGRYIFGFSTATGLALITAYALAVIILTPHTMACESMLLGDTSDVDANMLCSDHLKGYFTILILIITTAILAIGSYFENKRSRLIVICNLIKKYKDDEDKDKKLQIEMPVTCKIRYLKAEKKINKTAFNIIKDFLDDRKMNGIDTKLTDDMLINLLKNDVAFQGDLYMATEIIGKFKNNDILVDGYVNKTNLDRMHKSLQPPHGLHRRINLILSWIKKGLHRRINLILSWIKKGKNVEGEIK